MNTMTHAPLTIQEPGTAYVVGVKFPMHIPGYGTVENIQAWRCFLQTCEHRAQSAQALIAENQRLEGEIEYLQSEIRKLDAQVKTQILRWAVAE